KYLDSFCKKRRMLAMGAKWASQGHMLFERQRFRALGFVWNLLRAQLDDNQLINEKRKKIEEAGKAFTKVHPSKVKDLLQKEEKDPKKGARKSLATEHHEAVNKAQLQDLVGQVEEVLRQNVSYLKQTFRHYAIGPDGCGTMSAAEFSTMVRDCLVIGKDLTSAQVSAIFERANQDPDPGEDAEQSLETKETVQPDTLLDDEEDIEENPDAEFVPEEFTEALVRIAHAKFQKSDPTASTAQRLEKLLRTHVFNNCSRCDIDHVREMLQDDAVQAVFRKHSSSMEKVFMYYAGVDGVVGGATLSLYEFEAFCRDCRLFSGAFTDAAMTTIFSNVQDLLKGDDEAGELTFNAFYEAVAGVVNYKMCSPYQPFAQRLDQFIQRMVLPTAKQAKPRKVTAVKKSKFDAKGGK
ncbi:hypothetical protein CYMTET_35973, partial [Cymbomonas tetramitiformis]